MEDENREAGANGGGSDAAPGVSMTRRIAIGCFTSWLGFVSGAMVAALLSKFTAFLTKATECGGIPSCNWYIWAGIGGLIGAVTLPIMVLMVLGKPAKSGIRDSGL
jgi:hypothetical protein